MLTMTASEYAKQNPEVPAHMISHQGRQILVSGFTKGHPWLGSHYQGGYLHWHMADIRHHHYQPGWAAEVRTPFRVYVTDYDDWNCEGLFATEEEAMQVVKALQTEVISKELLERLGLTTH
jgi:hypothetical protein